MSHVRSHLPNVHPHPLKHTIQPPSSQDHATLYRWLTHQRPLICVCVCVCVCTAELLSSINTRRERAAKADLHIREHSPPPSLQIHAGTNCHTWRFDIPTSASRRMRGEKMRVEAKEEGGGTTEKEKKKGWTGGDDDNPFSPRQRRRIYRFFFKIKNLPSRWITPGPPEARRLMDAASPWSHGAAGWLTL